MKPGLFLILVLLPCIFFAQMRVENGVLDLSGVDLTEDKLIELNGKWRCYKHQLLRPGSIEPQERKYTYTDFTTSWEEICELDTSVHQFGYGSYGLNLIMPDSFPPMALVLPDINTAYELYLNDKLVEKSGIVGASKASSTPSWKQKSRSVELQPGANKIVLLTSNFHHHQGGPKKPLQLGSEERVLLLKNFQIGSLLFLAGCLAIAAIFSLGLFWFRPSDKSSLLFMAFCICYSHWVISSDFHFIYSLLDNMAWGVALRLQYIAFGLAAIFYTYFIKLVSEPYIRDRLFHMIAAVSALFIILVGTTSIPFFTLLIPVYFLFLTLSFILMSVLVLDDFNFGHKLAWVNTVGALALLVVLGHRVFVVFDWMYENPMIDIVSSVVFVFTQALALAIRFGRNYREFSMAAVAAARTRDEFLNTMSHELKTPMNAILGMASFLEQSELTKKQKDKLKAIRKNGESLLSLITDILSISEVGTGRLKLKKQPVNIESCIESAISLSSQHQKRDRVRFKTIVDTKIPSLLVGDSSRIKQILMHLLSNAFKFTDEGQVKLEVSLVEEAPEKVNIQFVVSDSGQGISKTQSAWLFEKFKQGQFGNTRKFGGAGLGLSVVNELVAMMGGTLRVNSKKNVGTRVEFNIILEQYKENETMEVHSIFEKNQVDTSLRIMYAEDNPVNQQLFRMMLESLGFNVDIAKNGVEAVEMARKKYYNIIFMDIQMPEMDGLEATTRIVENSRARPIIIAVTANLAEVDKPKCFEAGMNDFLHKPVQQDELKLAIIKWQGLKKYLDDSGDDSIKLSS